MKRIGKIIASLLALLVMLAGGMFALSEYALRRTYPAKTERALNAGSAALAEGRRLSRLYGCTSCHGPGFRGLLYNDDPMLVRNYAPNLTLSAKRYSDAQLAHAIRQGVSPADGRALWGMPSATFSAITDGEMAAVLTYLRSVPVGGAEMPADRPGLAARIAILRGMLLSPDVSSADPARAGTQQPAPVLVAAARRQSPIDAGREHGRGRHIATTVCSECHGADLGGDIVEGGPDLAIAAAYDREAFRRLMRTGVPPSGRNLGIMSQTAQEDLKVLTDVEIDGLHAYLAARAKVIVR